MNHLAQETSPYLLQHADNPVNWYPWSPEALALAKAENKPILLSIGYSACHWCHVMSHESFEDQATADYMNAHFINIKVDREERPDLDDLYMQATMAFTGGHGGWPMTVFLTPGLRPFHAGTYFPKTDRYGMPSFRRVMEAVIDAYQTRRVQIEQLAAEVTEGLQREQLGSAGDQSVFSPAFLEGVYQKMSRGYDPIHGGLHRNAPKFPSPMNVEFVLRMYVHSGHERAREIVSHTLTKMARGGMYDQIGGGFHRYSVDAEWLVPHFEKMLYDNAQLSRLYLHAYQATHDPFFREVAEQIYDYLLREMASLAGGFYSATDADSEGEEGKFFVWTAAEIREVLPPEPAEAVIAYYGVTEKGNFEGHNILNVLVDPVTIATQLNISPADLKERIEAARFRLYAVRAHRVHPGLDDKILTSWNGLTLSSFAEAARVLKREDYRIAAERCAEFLLTQMVTPEGRLYRTHKDGVSRLNGYLEDYAALAEGLLELYQTTFEPRYFREAQRLLDHVLSHFPASDGGFFDTSDDHETLIARPRAVQDNATPSGNSLMAKALLKLSAFTGEERYESAAIGVLRNVIAIMSEYPSAVGEALNALDLWVRGVVEVAIVGDPAQADTQALLNVLDDAYRPTLIRALTRDDVGEAQTPPLLDYRIKVAGKAAAYVCRKFVCQRPVTTPEELRVGVLPPSP